MNLFENLKRILVSLWTWVRQSRKNTIIAVCVFLAIVVGMVLLVRYVLPAIVTIVVIIVLFFGEHIEAALDKRQTQPPPMGLENSEIASNVCLLVADAFGMSKDFLGGDVDMGFTMAEIYNPNQLYSKIHGATALNLQLPLRRSAEFSDEDLQFIKRAVQAKIDARLSMGVFHGYNWAVPLAWEVPLVKLAKVESGGLYLRFQILLTNNPASIQAARLANKPVHQKKGDDTDQLFKD